MKLIVKIQMRFGCIPKPNKTTNLSAWTIKIKFGIKQVDIDAKQLTQPIPLITYKKSINQSIN